MPPQLFTVTIHQCRRESCKQYVCWNKPYELRTLRACFGLAIVYRLIIRETKRSITVADLDWGVGGGGWGGSYSDNMELQIDQVESPLCKNPGSARLLCPCSCKCPNTTGGGMQRIQQSNISYIVLYAMVTTCSIMQLLTDSGNRCSRSQTHSDCSVHITLNLSSHAGVRCF